MTTRTYEPIDCARCGTITQPDFEFVTNVEAMNYDGEEVDVDITVEVRVFCSECHDVDATGAHTFTAQTIGVS